MNLAIVSGAAGINAICNLLNGGSLTFYSGTQPSTPETALSGNTALAAFTFNNPAFTGLTDNAGQETLTASLANATVTPSANGTVTFARATVGTTAWTASHAYSVGQLVTNNSNIYQCIVAGTSASSGGPTTTATPILDGSAYWAYVGASSGNVVADFTVGTSGTDITVGSTSLSTGVQVTISSFKLYIPVV